MRPQMSLGPLDPREPRQRQWALLDPRTGGGPIWHFFEEDFFVWLSGQIVMIENYAYEGMDFTSDPYLIFPPSTNWGPQGKKVYLRVLKVFFKLLNVYVIFLLILWVNKY